MCKLFCFGIGIFDTSDMELIDRNKLVDYTHIDIRADRYQDIRISGYIDIRHQGIWISGRAYRYQGIEISGSGIWISGQRHIDMRSIQYFEFFQMFE